MEGRDAAGEAKTVAADDEVRPPSRRQRLLPQCCFIRSLDAVHGGAAEHRDPGGLLRSDDVDSASRAPQ